jgi:hypothetical protein
VNFLSSADGTEHSEVKRRIGREKQRVPAPAAVGRYNKNMQAVDRFDQLNQLFSLAERHKFQKYYNKLTMALLDIALVNAEQHYFMVEGRMRKDEARYKFRKELSQLFLETAWDFFESDGDVALNNLFMSPQEVTIQAPDLSPITRQRDNGFLMAPVTDEPKRASIPSQQRQQTTTFCHPISVMAYMKQNNRNQTGGRSYRGSRCQVCAWEKRPNVTKNVAFCSEHGIRMCTVHRSIPVNSPIAMALDNPHKLESLTEWYCPDQSATCWQKGHEFYIPKGLWGKDPRLRYDPSGCPKTISTAISASLYKKRAEWLVAEGFLHAAPKARGRKRKTEHGQQVEEPGHHDDDNTDEFFDSMNIMETV